MVLRKVSNQHAHVKEILKRQENYGVLKSSKIKEKLHLDVNL